MKYIYIVLISLSIGTVAAMAQKTTDSLFVRKISASNLQTAHRLIDSTTPFILPRVTKIEESSMMPSKSIKNACR